MGRGFNGRVPRLAQLLQRGKRLRRFPPERHPAFPTSLHPNQITTPQLKVSRGVDVFWVPARSAPLHGLPRLASALAGSIVVVGQQLRDLFPERPGEPALELLASLEIAGRCRGL